MLERQRRERLLILYSRLPVLQLGMDETIIIILEPFFTYGARVYSIVFNDPSVSKLQNGSYTTLPVWPNSHAFDQATPIASGC